MSALAWKSFTTPDGQLPFAVFVEGHQDLALASAELRERLQLGVMSLGYSKAKAREWVEAAEVGQFWLAPIAASGEDGQALYEFCVGDREGAMPITGAKFL